jgi:hypothetical protein
VLPRVFFRTLLFGLLCLAPSWAGSLKGRVTDPSGAAVPGVQVAIRSQSTPAVRTVTTDSAGAFSAEGLDPGTYTVAIEAPGFDKFEQTVNIPPTGEATIAIALKIAAEETAVEVSTKRSALANADPNYRALRAANIQETFRVENVVLKRDNGVLTLRSGMVSFARPVLGRVVMAVFRGDGQFTFTPVVDIERDYLVKIAEQKVVEESFDNALFAFTDATYEEIRKQGQPATDESAGGLLESAQPGRGAGCRRYGFKCRRPASRRSLQPCRRRILFRLSPRQEALILALSHPSPWRPSRPLSRRGSHHQPRR